MYGCLSWGVSFERSLVEMCRTRKYQICAKCSRVLRLGLGLGLVLGLGGGWLGKVLSSFPCHKEGERVVVCLSFFFLEVTEMGMFWNRFRGDSV